MPGRQASATPLLDAAIRYSQDHGWAVVPGVTAVAAAGVIMCSCGAAGCAALGAHPESPDWVADATGNPLRVRRWWTEQPDAAIVVPTGRSFDVLDVPEQAGCLALARLERMGIPLGPVAATPTRRMLFLVAPGGAEKLPMLLRRLGWGNRTLDIVCHGDGGYILVPPSRMGMAGAVMWARPPACHDRWLPDAHEVVAPIAYACARETPRAMAH